MKSTTSVTTPSRASSRLISRTMQRLIFCNRRSCCSVRARRCSNSFALDTDNIIPRRAGVLRSSGSEHAASAAPQEQGARAHFALDNG